MKTKSLEMLCSLHAVYVMHNSVACYLSLQEAKHNALIDASQFSGNVQLSELIIPCIRNKNHAQSMADKTIILSPRQIPS